MPRGLPVSSNTISLVSVRNTLLKGLALCAAAATSTIEVFDGSFGTIATKAIGAAGNGYLVGDTVTLVAASGGVQAVFTVASIGGSGDVTGLTLVDGGTGYVAGSTYATTTNSVAGSGLTVTASTVTDSGTSLGKLSAVANESAPPLELDCGVLSTLGLSVRITGASAKGHVYYE